MANLYYAQPVLHQVAARLPQRDPGRPPGSSRPPRSATPPACCSSSRWATCTRAAASWRGSSAWRRWPWWPARSLPPCGSSPWPRWRVGAASVAGQVMIPFAADLAPEERRGRVVARIMTGLLAGHPARPHRLRPGGPGRRAGAPSTGSRPRLMVLFALVLWRALPAEGARPHRSYGELVGSSLRLLATEPVLRRRAWHGACAFAMFSVLWTTLAFLLSGQPLRLLQRGDRAVRPRGRRRHRGGQPGRQAGRLCPRHRRPPSSRASSSSAPSRCSGPGTPRSPRSSSGIVVLDIGTQGMQITNQAVIYTLRPDARSRINSAYMVLLLPRRRRRLLRRRSALRHPRLGGRVPPRCGLRPRHPGHVGLRQGATTAPNRA